MTGLSSTGDIFITITSLLHSKRNVFQLLEHLKQRIFPSTIFISSVTSIANSSAIANQCLCIEKVTARTSRPSPLTVAAVAVYSKAKNRCAPANLFKPHVTLTSQIIFAHCLVYLIDLNTSRCVCLY